MFLLIQFLSFFHWNIFIKKQADETNKNKILYGLAFWKDRSFAGIYVVLIGFSAPFVRQSLDARKCQVCSWQFLVRPITELEISALQTDRYTYTRAF